MKTELRTKQITEYSYQNHPTSVVKLYVTIMEVLGKGKIG